MLVSVGLPARWLSRCLLAAALFTLVACGGPGVDPDAGSDAMLPDGTPPGEPVLRVRFEFEFDGEPVTGPVEFDGVELERLVLGVERLAWHGERGDAPSVMQVGALDMLAGPVEVDVSSVPPGLYSQVDVDLELVDGALPFELEGTVDGDVVELRIEEPMHLEERCEGGAIEVGFDGVVAVPVRVRLESFEDILREPPESDAVEVVLDALEGAFEVKCDDIDDERRAGGS